MSGMQLTARVTRRERTPFEWHALLLIELALVLAFLGMLYSLGRSIPNPIMIASALPSIAVLGVAVVALLVRWWWAPAAAVGVLWALVIQGATETVMAATSQSIVIPLGAIIAGLVLWVDRPRLSDRGRPWAWAWIVLGVVAWAFGVLLVRWTWLAANWW
ncbi:MAG: hypothetical protein U0869_00100 [Chloroflexota bacterium]